MTREDIRSCDIRCRNEQRFLRANAITGPYHDPDDCLWMTEGGVFILTCRSGEGGERRYVVPEPLALDCIEKISASAGTADGSGEYRAVVLLNGRQIRDADPMLLKERFAGLAES